MIIATIKKSLRKILFWAAIVLMAVFILFPFYWMLVSALKTEAQLHMTPATFLPRDPETLKFSLTFFNFRAVFRDPTLLRGLKNSLIVAGAGTLIALVLGSLAGFAIAKLRFRGKTAVLYFMFAMTMFPAISLLTGLYTVINTLHIPALLSVILSYMIFMLPLATWLLYVFFRRLPDELLQAAYVDGASPFQAFYLVMLPLIGPGLVTAGLLTFIAAWNEYLFALTFATLTPEAKTVTATIADYRARYGNFGQIMAAGVFLAAPLVIFVLYFQRQIIEGLTARGWIFL